MNILIADDHALFRHGLRRFLAAALAPADIAEAGSLDAAIDAIGGGDFQLILVDLDMPGMGGPADVAKVVDRARGAFVVVVAASERPADMVEAIRAGAVGYIPKASTPEVALNILNLVLAGGVYVPPEALRAAEGGRPGAPPESGPAGGPMTDRQRQVLDLIAAGKTNKEIARCLGLSISTVKLHVAAVLQVLGVDNRTEAATAAVRRGIVSRS